ncbi:MAG: cation:proton antiporter, partial [Candidatus Competibacterales bacterium]
MALLEQTALFLGAAVVAVPLFKRAGLGAVLGYMAAGVVIGPEVTGLIAAADDTLHVAELGVVLLLFIIGLELQPSRLWVLRHAVFGLGTAQVLTCGAALGLVATGLGLSLGPAILVGITLALSSTALALQLLAERHQLTTRHGRAAFAMLLFQDLAVIPLLALMPLLATNVTEMLAPEDWAWAVVQVVGVVAAVV